VTGAILEGKMRIRPHCGMHFWEFCRSGLRKRWVELHEPEERTNVALQEFEELIHNWRVFPAGTRRV